MKNSKSLQSNGWEDGGGANRRPTNGGETSGGW